MICPDSQQMFKQTKSIQKQTKQTNTKNISFFPEYVLLFPVCAAEWLWPEDQQSAGTTPLPLTWLLLKACLSGYVHFKGISGSKIHIQQGSGAEPKNQVLLCCSASCSSISRGDLTVSLRLTCHWRSGSHTEVALSRRQLFSSRILIESDQPQNLMLSSNRTSILWREKRLSNVIETKVLACCRFISKPSVWDVTCKPHIDIFPRFVHSGKTFLEIEEAAAATPFMLWFKTGK